MRKTTLTPLGSQLFKEIAPRMLPGTLDLEASGFNGLVALIAHHM
jgi:hypothetical protein